MSGLRLANAAFALPLKTPALAVLRPTEKLLVSLACAATPARLPLALNGPAAPPMVPTSTSFGAAIAAVFVTETLRAVTTSPLWTMPKSTTPVLTCATAGV